jgi:catechol 2,3-dioxygenase-like lactoylglutathione lyase family enzyme
MSDAFPTLRSVVLDTTDVRGLAEFYRELLGYQYRPGDEHAEDFVMLLDPAGRTRVAFQQVGELPPSTWPSARVPQQLHLDLSVTSIDELRAQHERALALGARLLEDRSDDAVEPLFVYADPAGHPFCIFVVPPS